MSIMVIRHDYTSKCIILFGFGVILMHESKFYDTNWLKCNKFVLICLTYMKVMCMEDLEDQSNMLETKLYI